MMYYTFIKISLMEEKYNCSNMKKNIYRLTVLNNFPVFCLSGHNLINSVHILLYYAKKKKVNFNTMMYMIVDVHSTTFYVRKLFHNPGTYKASRLSV